MRLEVVEKGGKRSMDLRQLRYFIEVAEAGGFNGAAARLHVSQSSISRRIRDLELELGVQLFERTPSGAQLTESGRILLERGVSILRDVEHARADVAMGSAEPVGTVTIGMSPACAQLIVAPLLRRVETSLPLVRLQFLEGAQYALLEAIETGKADIALVISPEGTSSYSVQSTPPERLSYVCSGSYKLPPAVEISALAGIPLVLFPRPSANRDYLDRAAKAAGVQLQVAYEIADLSVQKQIISGGHAAGILPMTAIRNEIQRGELVAAQLQNLSISRSIIWRSSRKMPASAQAVIILVDAVVRALQGVDVAKKVRGRN
jgi:LysR family nitrogen assimilation transcriptional regulator